MLESELVAPQLALLLQNSTSPSPWQAPPAADCELGVLEGGGLGTVGRSGAGVGVISALIGGGGSNRGWLISFLTTIDQQQISSPQEWNFENASCWFELQEGLGFEESFYPVK